MSFILVLKDSSDGKLFRSLLFVVNVPLGGPVNPGHGPGVQSRKYILNNLWMRSKGGEEGTYSLSETFQL